MRPSDANAGVLRVMYALEAGLRLAQAAILAAHPELRGGGPSRQPLRLGGGGWIADEILSHLGGLTASITRYALEVERGRDRRATGAWAGPNAPVPPGTGRWAA